MITQTSLKAEFERDGYVLIANLIPAAELESLAVEVDRLLGQSRQRGGVRNVLHKSPRLRQFAASGTPFDLGSEILGPEARPTKLTVFDKTPSANWKVPWHQDLTISVRERIDLPGFGPWSVKEGVPHVQPPTAVLESALALRLHLDDTPSANGALRVLVGSHRFGRLSDRGIADLRKSLDETVCSVTAGGVMLMSPLLLHASSASERPSRRRVLHFEYCASSLPGGLSWA